MLNYRLISWESARAGKICEVEIALKMSEEEEESARLHNNICLSEFRSQLAFSLSFAERVERVFVSSRLSFSTHLPLFLSF